MRVDDLNDEAVIRVLKQVLTELHDDDDLGVDNARDILSALVDVLDDGDLMDCHGTEGWKHRYRLED
jgi:hypothetical protein